MAGGVGVGGVGAGWEGGGEGGVETGVETGVEGGVGGGVEAGVEGGVEGGVDCVLPEGVDGVVEAGCVFLTAALVAGGWTAEVPGDCLPLKLSSTTTIAAIRTIAPATQHTMISNDFLLLSGFANSCG